MIELLIDLQDEEYQYYTHKMKLQHARNNQAYEWASSSVSVYKNCEEFFFFNCSFSTTRVVVIKFQFDSISFCAM